MSRCNSTLTNMLTHKKKVIPSFSCTYFGCYSCAKEDIHTYFWSGTSRISKPSSRDCPGSYYLAQTLNHLLDLIYIYICTVYVLYMYKLRPLYEGKSEKLNLFTGKIICHRYQDWAPNVQKRIFLVRDLKNIKTLLQGLSWIILFNSNSEPFA